MLLALLLGFALGSVPIAWILVRWRAGRDVSTEGSGNVGALNALRVSRSILVGVLVVLLDALKGAIAAWSATRLGLAGEPLQLQAAATVGAVAGHDYNPWLSLHRRRLAGGKGFAAAAGALLVFRPWLVVVWLGVGVVAWVLIYLGRRIADEAPATAVATLALLPAAIVLHDAPTLWMCVALAVLVAPKLVGEVRGLLRPSA